MLIMNSFDTQVKKIIFELEEHLWIFWIGLDFGFDKRNI